MYRLPFLAAAMLVALPAVAVAHGLSGEAADKSTLEFVPLGIEHMLLGWDHLLFICGVVLLAGGFDRAVKLISTFVAGHSTTLILASLADWRVSPTAVDAVIALSVVCVGVIGLRGRPDDWRPMYAMVGGFGLIHGFGLATRLLDLGLPDDGVLGKVIAFNVGLEIGQVLAIAVVMGIVYWAARLLSGRWTSTRRAVFGAMTVAGLIAAAVISFPDDTGDDTTPVVADAPGAANASSADSAACSQVDRRSRFGMGGGHPPRQWYDKGEAVPVIDFGHVVGDGYVLVMYARDLSEAQVRQLQAIVDVPGQQTVGGEDPEQPEPIRAYTARRELVCERFDAAAVKKFTDTWLADLRAGRIQ